jgi:ATP synthase protein I
MADTDLELEKRRKLLEAALASKDRENKSNSSEPNRTGTMAGTAYALKVSSEFIAAILVGVAIGALLDKLAGTSPWGLIIFLFLGFVAGILNVLRNAGLIAVSKSERGSDYKPSQGDNTPAGNAWADDEEDK